MVGVSELLQVLPPFEGKTQVIKRKQDVSDIIREVVAAHKEFAGDYDQIAKFFLIGDVEKMLFEFCMKHLPYQVEPERMQTTKSPAGIIATAAVGGVDCKHYAGFIAGVLDAVNRTGKDFFDWSYRFVSYNVTDQNPGHVFVVVQEDNGSETWLDPAPIIKKNRQIIPRQFNDRFVTPWYKIDKKVSTMLARIRGIEENAMINGFQSEVVVKRSDLVYNDKNVYGSCGCACSDQVGQVGLLIDPQTGLAVYQTAAIDATLKPFIAANTGCVTDAIENGVQFLVDGRPLIFPAHNNGTIPLPANLQIIYPATYAGVSVRADLPRPIVVGPRLILLPKGSLSILQENNLFGLCFLTSVMAPLVIAYSTTAAMQEFLKRRLSSSNQYDTGLSHAIYFDMDNSDVVDYIKNMPTKIPISAAKPEGVRYIDVSTGKDLLIPPRRDFATIEEYQNTPAPLLPPFVVAYPASYLGKAIPTGMPKPIYAAGQVQLEPKGFDWNILKEENFFWLSFLTSVMYQLVMGYSQFPYGDNGNQLADRILFDQDESDVVNDYLFPPEAKTWVGNVLQGITDIIQDVAHVLVRFIGIVPRTAFIGLLRLNVHNWAKVLYDRIQTTQGLNEVKDRWYKVGGGWGDLHDAINDGHSKNRILGIQGIGVAGADDALALLAAAAPIIAVLASLLKSVDPDAAAAIDKAIGTINGVLQMAGYDPISTGSAAGGVPVSVKDPVTGKMYTIQPPASNATTNFSISDFIKANPIESALIGAGAAVGIYSLVKPKKRTI